MSDTCQEPACQQPQIARGYCPKHYARRKAEIGVVRDVRRFTPDELKRLRAIHRAQWTAAGVEHGFCLCGCGEQTRVATTNSRQRGTLAGEPVEYRSGHATRGRWMVGWDERDCGYETPCWVWRGRVDKKGYAGHRKVYQRLREPIPRDVDLDHLCRNPSCVNPDHLEPVPRTVNLRRGEGTKLTVEQVREIKRRAARMSGKQNTVAREIAKDYPTVTHHNIRNILRGMSWRDVN